MYSGTDKKVKMNSTTNATSGIHIPLWKRPIARNVSQILVGCLCQWKRFPVIIGECCKTNVASERALWKFVEKSGAISRALLSSFRADQRRDRPRRDRDAAYASGTRCSPLGSGVWKGSQEWRRCRQELWRTKNSLLVRRLWAKAAMRRRRRG